MKRAFTLIEMLVVIAIIGILATVLMGTFSGGTDSAQTARCLTNMRNLAAACQSVGVARGYYPPAGSVETVEVVLATGNKAENHYSEVQGWISWNSQGAYAQVCKSHRQNDNVSTYTQDDDARLYALTNGALWKYVNGNASVYLCPLHQKKMKDLNPCWSYVMNAAFKWDSTKGRGSMPEDDWGGITYGRLNQADRRLLFAELQFVSNAKKLEAVGDPPEETSGATTDAILQYSGCTGGGTEMIGFNHKTGKNYCANVVFADGHTEKLLYPKSADTQQLQNLTKWLCLGKDVSYDGKQYELLNQ